MADQIGLQPISVIKALQTPEVRETGAAELGQSFSDVLSNTLNQLASQEKSVEALNDQFIRGEAVDVHDLTINAERLALGLELTVQIRNKVIEAYQDIMRMQI